LPNLYLVETVDSIRIADKLNKSVAKTKSIKQLKIMIQVNTSGEERNFLKLFRKNYLHFFKFNVRIFKFQRKKRLQTYRCDRNL